MPPASPATVDFRQQLRDDVRTLALALKRRNECTSLLDGTFAPGAHRKRKRLSKRECRDLERNVAEATTDYERALRRLRRRRVPQEIEAIVACARRIA